MNPGRWLRRELSGKTYFGMVIAAEAEWPVVQLVPRRGRDLEIQPGVVWARTLTRFRLIQLIPIVIGGAMFEPALACAGRGKG